MYKIKRNNHLPSELTGLFNSYEKARNAVRNYIRKRYGDPQHRNSLSISARGFSVVKA